MEPDQVDDLETEAPSDEAAREDGAHAAPALPEQHDFYKMPAKFGHVPVAEEPLGWDRRRRFEHLYPRVRLPTQVVERFEFGSPQLEPNRLYFGDNLHVMRSLPTESVDLIYIDPPFFSQRTYNVLFGDQNELRSFRDIWEGGLNGYLVWLNARLYEMKRLLSPHGVLVIHVDWHAVHYVKVELDKLFGYDRFLNELVWHYGGRGAKAIGGQFPRNHDVLLAYGRGPDNTYERQYVESHLTGDEARKRGFRQDPDGRWFKTAPRGDYTDASVAKLEKEGRIHRTRTGGVRIKYWLEQRDRFVGAKARGRCLERHRGRDAHAPKRADRLPNSEARSTSYSHH